MKNDEVGGCGAAGRAAARGTAMLPAAAAEGGHKPGTAARLVAWRGRAGTAASYPQHGQADATSIARPGREVGTNEKVGFAGRQRPTCHRPPRAPLLSALQGEIVDLYIPRKCSWTNKLITAKDHGAVQLNIGHLDEAGVYSGSFSTFALCGQLRSKVGPRACLPASSQAGSGQHACREGGRAAASGWHHARCSCCCCCPSRGPSALPSLWPCFVA
jgi:hypothetical protein